MKTKTIFKTSKTLYLKLVALLLLVTVFASCTKTEQEIGTAYVKITNADETSLPQDFYIDGAKLNTSALGYAESTGFLAVDTKDHQAEFRTSSTGTVNYAFPVSLGIGTYYSLFYLGQNKAVAYSDDPTPPPAGKARVRFINLSTTLTGAVDFSITNGNTLTSSLPQYAATNYSNVDPTVSFKVYAAGTTNVLLDIPAGLQAGKIYTIYATGSTAVGFRVIVNN